MSVASLDDGSVAVRDTKDPSASALLFTRDEMRAWIAGCKAGEFDDLM